MVNPASYRPAPGTIPTDPGVYRFIDPQGEVIYVGKARNLRQRLNSYFADLASLHSRTQRMVQTAAKVEWTVVQNELESLQLEYTWIKKYDPRFNIRYRDDKSYPWLCITWSEEFPRVFVGRGPRRAGWRYFGPYGQAWAIRDTVDLLLRVFPMRSCSAGVFRTAQASGRPCLLGYIGKCSAPCVGRVTAEEHREIVNDFSAFFSGRTGVLEKKLSAQMVEAAAREEYEQAAIFRDSLEALKQATERNAIVLLDGTDADVVAMAVDPLELAVHVFHVRDGRVQGEQGWVADRADDSPPEELIESFLLQLYSETDRIPRNILVQYEPSAGTAVADLLAEQRGGPVHLRVPKRGDKRILMDTVAKNAAEKLAQHKLKRASDLAIRNQALEELQVALNLDSVPFRIECYDISHTQGSNPMGSMIVFEDGLPRKSEYRVFAIKSSGNDDTAAMREVLTRRFHRMHQDQSDNSITDVSAARRFAYAPSLIVVDGGLPQVNAAQAVLTELGVQGVALCGLAKRLEEVWLPDEEDPIILPRASEGLYLLQRVRDEAHRFAITKHRNKRSRAMVESVLDEVPGLGEVRRKNLLKYFGSLKKLRAASVDEISQVPGFGIVTAQAVVDALSRQTTATSINVTTGEVSEI